MAPAGTRERFAIEKIPENLLREPLNYLVSDHFRQTRVCGNIEHLLEAASGALEQDGLGNLLGFLETDFLDHMADETEFLFPRLRERCVPEDAADPILGSVTRGHENDRLLASELTEALRKVVARGDQTEADRLARIAVALIESLRSHLPLEDDRLLPLARKRLTDADLDALGRSMAARRGIPYPD